jgi:glycosyltransferase involved in cell wall biosynthesis
MKARMLFISPEFPYPPSSGGRLRTFSLLKYLARHFEIHCVTFAQEQPGQKDLEMLRTDLGGVTVLPLAIHRRTTLRRYYRNVGRALRFIPPLVDRFAEPPIHRALCTLLENHGDWVWLEHLWLAPYIKIIPRSATSVLDVHNVESDFYRQLRCFTRNPLERLGYYVFEHAARRVEQEHLASFDRVLAASPDDGELLARNCSREKIFIAPNAVEIGPPPVADGEQGFSIYFAGRLDYAPNREAVRWFHRQVWPVVRRQFPEARWTIVGACPELLGEDLLRDPQAVLTGSVEQTRPYLYPSSLVIVPLSLGGGTRFKILEAWSAGKAVVATSKGAEGLTCQHGENIWIANTPDEFARAVVRMLSDPVLRARLGRRGWETVKQEYSWERLHQSLDLALGMPPRG